MIIRTDVQLIRIDMFYFIVSLWIGMSFFEINNAVHGHIILIRISVNFIELDYSYLNFISKRFYSEFVDILTLLFFLLMYNCTCTYVRMYVLRVHLRTYSVFSHLQFFHATFRTLVI